MLENNNNNNKDSYDEGTFTENIFERTGATADMLSEFAGCEIPVWYI